MRHLLSGLDLPRLAPLSPLTLFAIPLSSLLLRFFVFSPLSLSASTEIPPVHSAFPPETNAGPLFEIPPPRLPFAHETHTGETRTTFFQMTFNSRSNSSARRDDRAKRSRSRSRSSHEIGPRSRPPHELYLLVACSSSFTIARCRQDVDHRRTRGRGSAPSSSARSTSERAVDPERRHLSQLELAIEVD